MVSGFAEYVIGQLNDQKASLTGDLASGRAGSFEEYKSMTGRIEGLTQAIATIKESAQKYERE